MSPVYVKTLKNIVSVLKPAILIAVLIFSVFLSGSAFAAIPATERAALIALYNSTDGDNWTDNSGWKTPPLEADGFAQIGTEDTWYGVTCVLNTYVHGIDLNSNNLSGTIPSELSNLTNLYRLDLYRNQLTGTIPAELGGLANLVFLSLYENQLTGAIPAELGLTELGQLNLSFNQLTGSIPAELGNLTNLTRLYLRSNQLTGSIPAELGNLTNLTRLHLGSNQLTDAIPPELGNLTNLAYFDLRDNLLTGNIPSEFGYLTNLLRISLDSNDLAGPIPSELINLTSLDDSQCDFRWNGLFTSDPVLRDFINSKQIGGDWESFQYLAEIILDQDYSESGDAGYAVYSERHLGESFTIQNGGELTHIYLFIDYYQGLGSSLTFEVQTLSGGLPSGISLASITIDPSDFPDIPDWYLFDLSSFELEVAPGDRFAIVLSSSGTFSEGFSWFGNSASKSDPFPDEIGYAWDPATGWEARNVEGNYLDLTFKVYVDTAIPIPNVVNMTQAAAESAITAAGLTVGNITSACDDIIAAGNVISSDPVAGTSGTPGTAVDLVVSTGACPVNVPNVVNISQAAATSAITSAGLTVGNVTTACDNNVVSGNVISSNPVAGTSVAPGTAVDIIVSTGACPVNVPNVVNMTQAAATSAITSAGLTVGNVTTACDNNVVSGNVISSNPVSGTSVPPGTAVDLVVSTGPCPVAVPNVVNMTQVAAESDITAVGLTVGNVTTACDGSIAAGSVISSDPAGGTSVPPGTAVDIVVSTGPCPQVPDVVNMTQADAESAIVAAGLTVGNVTTACDDTIAAGSVIISGPPVGVSVVPGTSIGIVVSSGQCVQNTPMVYFNTLPTQLSDGSGKVEVSVEVDDSNGDDCRLKVEYSEDNITWHSATIEQGTVVTEFGSTPDVDNSESYQIGNNVPIPTGNTNSNTIGLKWLSDVDLSGVFDENVYMRVTVSNSTNESFTAYPLMWSGLGGSANIDFLESSYFPTQIELDPQGNPNIFAGASFTKWNGSNWVKADGTTPGFDSISNPSYLTMMRLSADGNPSVVFITGSGLCFTKWNGTEWTHADGVTPGEQIITTQPVNEFQFQMDSSGDPAILIEYTSDLYFIKWNGTEWTHADGVTPGIESIVTYSDRYWGYQQLQLDPLGNPNIMWTEFSSSQSWGDLFFIKWSGSAWTGADGITAGKQYIEFDVNAFDFKLESSGNPQVVYMHFALYTDGATDATCFKRWNGTYWRGMDGVSAGVIATSTRQNPKLEIDFRNYPHLLYNLDSHSLRHLKWDVTNWDSELNFPPYEILSDSSQRHRLALDNFSAPYVISDEPDGFILTKWNGGIDQTNGGSWTGLVDTGATYDVLGDGADAYIWPSHEGSVIDQLDAKMKFNSDNIPYVVWADANGNVYLKYGREASFVIDNRTDVPDVINMVQATAASTITAAGLTVGNVTTACDNVIASGNVISSNPVAGTSVTPGTAVDLVVSTGPCSVNVPNVVNMNQAAAESAITFAGLTVGTVTTACDNTIASGNVISSNPPSGTSVAPGTAVDIIVSTGPCPVNVPDVVNMTQAAAESAITSAGLTVGTVTTACDNTIASGNVISSNPASGISVPSGTAVDLVVSTGPCSVNVPNVVNMTQAAAESAITFAGLNVGTVTTACDNTIAAGNVISSNPAAGISVPPGTAIDLVASTGPCLVSVPDVVNTTQASATSVITSAGLTVGDVTTACDNSIAAGNVITTDPISGTSVAPGSAVDFLVSTGSCERAALIALYNSTDGDNWSDNSGWKTPLLEADGFAAYGTENTWFGVTCDVGNDHVTGITLNSNHLTGSIPPELGNLTNLASLDLSGNQLTGSIPAELGNLTNLKILYLYNNQLSGAIPPELGNLTNLIYLRLFNNPLTGSIPAELGNLTNLTSLDLRSNQLTGSIPPELGTLTNLIYLGLNQNQLTGSIPAELGDLANLAWLDIESNQLTGSIPAELGNLTNLTELYLWGNQLTGSIPAELGNLTNLAWLMLYDNHLTGSIPAELGNLTNLAYIVLDNNQLTGSIPSELGNLPNLREIYLSNNQLTGSIPSELGNLPNPYSLHLSDNYLDGAIPVELGNLTNLASLDLSGNQLTGSIPAELGNLINLHYLLLYDNELDGPIPVELENLTSLVDDSSNFCSNHLYTSDSTLRDFLNSKQVGGDWESCQTFSVPDLVNVTQATAESMIISAGLTVGTVSTTCDNTIAAGSVISSNPAAGTSVAPGTAVELVVSTGPCSVDIPVPNVVNTAQASATSAITSAGLTVGNVTTACDDTIAAGNVISSNPVAATSVPPGTAVDLVVSTGPCSANVPDVVNTTQASAESSITTANLTVGSITTACDNTIAAGNVISSTPAAGTSVPSGTAVDLVVSTGPCLPSVSWSSDSQTVSEDVGTVTVTATLTETSASDVTVPFTVSGTADTLDHDLVDGSILISSGNLSGSETFNVFDDSDFESEETVTLTMGPPINANLGTITEHMVTIEDNDITCTYLIDSNSESYPVAGGTDSVTVNASDNSCEWTAVSNDSWITITSESDYTGDGTVSFDVSVNSTGAGRTGTLTIAGETLTIFQSHLSADFKLSVCSNTTDGSTIFKDGSPANHAVTAGGDTRHVNSGDDTAIQFDGTGDYLSLANSSDWDFGNGDFTIDLWVNFATTPDQYDGIFSTSPVSGGYYMCILNKTIQWHSSSGYLNTGVKPTPGQWYHLAVVRSSDVLSVYVDGVEKVNTGCADQTFNSGGTGLVLGRIYTNVSGYNFKGLMDEITVTKVTARWDTNFTPPNPPVDDADNDGLSYTDEFTNGTNPNLADTDGDGISDPDEINEVDGYDIDPTLADTDGDGINDKAEIDNSTYNIDPTKADTDGDGFDDKIEIDAGTDPTLDTDFPVMSADAKLYIQSNTTNGSTAFADISVAKHPVTANGNVQHVTSGDNTAINFDGTGDYLSLANSSDWDFGNGDFTIDLWVNFATTPDQYDGIFSTSPVSGGYYMCILNKTIQWHSSSGYLNTGVKPTPGQWYHLAVVRSSDVLSVYVDGVEKVNTGCADQTFNSGGTGLVLGRIYTNVSGYNFKGLMDEITVTKVTARWDTNFTPPNPPVDDADNDGLSYTDEFTNGTNPNLADTDGDGISDPDEINEVDGYDIDPTLADTDGDGINDKAEIDNSTYNIDPTKADTDGDGFDDKIEIDAGTDPTLDTDFPVMSADAKLYIQSNTTNGSTAFADISVAKHPVTANGNVQHVTSGDNTAINFDGTGDYLSLANSSDWDFGNGEFTIDLWVNFNSTPAMYDGIFSTSPVSGGYYMCILNKTIQWHSSSGYLNTGVKPTPGQWYHLAVIRSSDVLSVYVDGVEKVNTGCADQTFNSGGTGLVLGRIFTNYAGFYFDGQMDEITVTKAARWDDDFISPNHPDAADAVKFTLIQTSDVHDHASGFGPYTDYTPLTADGDVVMGGYARLATVIGGIKQEQGLASIPTLTVDSGDWYMGTTYDMTVSPDPISLRFFQLMGYDAITLGNHEFDWTSVGLAQILGNAMTADYDGLGNGFSVPVVATNTVFDFGTSADNALESFAEPGVGVGTYGLIVQKLVKTLPNGLTVGILGALGPDADKDTPVAPPVTFEHAYSFLQAKVNELRNTDGVDCVILLSHTGIKPDGTGDDTDIAENVTGIDIIASGHYHTATITPFVRGDSHTLVFSPGEYGEYVSRLDVEFSPGLDRVTKADFQLKSVDDSVAGNATMQGMVDAYDTGINSALTPLGVQLDTPISSTSFDLTMDSPIADAGITGIGSLCVDSVRNVSNVLAPYNFGTDYTAAPFGFGTATDFIDIGIVANGVVRDPLLAGKTGAISFSDVYNCLPLGISPYQSSPPGYPIMHAYLYGSEVKTLCALSLGVSQAIGNTYYLNFSGLQIEYDPSIGPYGVYGIGDVKVYSPTDPLCLGAAGGQPAPVSIVEGDLYHIAVDLYALQMLGHVQAALSMFGLPSIYPRDANGNVLDLGNGALVGSLRIDADGTGTELKEWMALLKYLPNLDNPPGSGTPGIPSSVYDHENGLGAGVPGFVAGRVTLP